MQIKDSQENHVVSSFPTLDTAKESISRRRNGRRRGGKGLKMDSKNMLFSEAKGTPPASCKSLFMFHRRPGYGQLGTKCMVKANHFLAEIPDTDLSHYSVSFINLSCRVTLLINLSWRACLVMDFVQDAGRNNPRSYIS